MVEWMVLAAGNKLAERSELDFQIGGSIPI